MKRPMKILLIIIALALLAYVLAFIVWPGGRGAPAVSDASRGPSFEVRVERPRIDRFLYGILPVELEETLLGGGALRFGHASPGARVGGVGPDRIELKADGWDLLVETDGRGGIGRGTRLVFPMELAEVKYRLRCRPTDGPAGYLHAAPRKDSDLLDGQFVVELSPCENAETGKAIDTEAGGSPGRAWPSPPLTLRGSFAGLPQGR